MQRQSEMQNSETFIEKNVTEWRLMQMQHCTPTPSTTTKKQSAMIVMLYQNSIFTQKSEALMIRAHNLWTATKKKPIGTMKNWPNGISHSLSLSLFEFRACARKFLWWYCEGEIKISMLLRWELTLHCAEWKVQLVRYRTHCEDSVLNSCSMVESATASWSPPFPPFLLSSSAGYAWAT